MPDAATWAYVLIPALVLICAYVLLSRRPALLATPPSAPQTARDQSLHTLLTAGLLCESRVGGMPENALALAPAPSDTPVRTANVNDPRAILFGVATTLSAMHSLNVVHGNLHIDAIYLVGGDIVIISGLDHCGICPVQPTQSDWTNPPPGHLPSMAPELVTTGIRTTQTDVYAFGRLMYRMYAGDYPFANQPSSSRLIPAGWVQLASGKQPLREAIQHPHFTDEVWTLMTECCALEPSARPTMEDVLARLSAQSV